MNKIVNNVLWIAITIIILYVASMFIAPITPTWHLDGGGDYSQSVPNVDIPLKQRDDFALVYCDSVCKYWPSSEGCVNESVLSN